MIIMTIYSGICMGIVYYAEHFVIFIASKPFPVMLYLNLFGSRKGAIVFTIFSAFPNNHGYLTITLYSVAIKI